MKDIKVFFTIFILFFSLGIFSAASAHPGRTDSVGCHTCRTNCPSWGLGYNEYHCHRSKGLPQPTAPVRSSQDGYTVPAPDYETPVDYEPFNAKSSTIEIEQPIVKSQKVALTTQDEESSLLWWFFAGVGIVGVYIFYKKSKRVD